MIYDIFNIHRIIKLFNTKIIENRIQLVSSLLLTFFGSLFLFFLLILSNSTLFLKLNQDDAFLIFNIVLFIGGIVYSERQLSIVKKTGDNWFYFMLPASQLEKIIVIWVFATIGYLIICLTGFYLASILVKVYFQLKINVNVKPINIFSKSHFFVVPIFFILQQMIFVLVVKFQKYVFIVIAVFLLVILMLIKAAPDELLWFLSMGNVTSNLIQISGKNFNNCLILYNSLFLIINLLIFVLMYNLFKRIEIKNI
jgi:hypothetical protein